MPTLEIPGYYYDETKKRYFKIMPTGKYSLASLKQAKRQQEKEKKETFQQLQEKRRKISRSNLLIPSSPYTSSLYTFYHQRSLHSILPMKAMKRYGIQSLYSQLIQQCQTSLDPIRHDYFLHCTNMIMNKPSNEFILGDKNGFIVRYGFHPSTTSLQTWKTSLPFQTYPNITSLHISHPTNISSSIFTHSLSSQQHIIGTHLGSNDHIPNQVWRLSLPATLSQHQPLEEQTPEIICSFSRRQGSFWSSYVSDPHERVLVGGDKTLFILNSECELISQVKCKSSILATQLVDDQPHLIWIGCRNGDVQLIDDRAYEYTNRDNKKIKHIIQFQQHSSITHLKTLDNLSSGHSILTAGMNGSIYIWDQRFASSSSSTHRHNLDNHNYNHNHNHKMNSKPIQRFNGHSNEHTRQLAFDLDRDTNTFTMSGDDNKVRLWSLTENKSNVDPFWSSPSFNGSIPHATIFSSFYSTNSTPYVQPTLSTINNNNQENQDEDDDNRTATLHSPWKSNPGILICSQTQHNNPSLHWYSID